MAQAMTAVLGKAGHEASLEARCCTPDLRSSARKSLRQRILQLRWRTSTGVWQQTELIVKDCLARIPLRDR
jgi:hypothetical protein